MGKPRVLLADDHALVLEAFKKLLECEFAIAGVATNGRQLLEIAPQLNPDVILIDIGMPRLNGMDAGQQIKTLLPKAKLIVLTMNEDYEIASKALRGWADGYLLKSSAGCELVRAIRRVLKGYTYVTPSIARRQEEEFIRDPRLDHAKNLTTRQREVLQLLAEGCSMKEVANQLTVTARTVAFHKYRIMEVFGLKTNSDLIRLAIRERLLSPVCLSRELSVTPQRAQQHEEHCKGKIA